MTDYSRDSSFNMGIAHLTRIDGLLYDVAMHAHEEDYERWHNTLTILSREVFFLFDSEEMNKNIELDNTCAEAISNFKIEHTFLNKSKAYNALIAYELFIKQELAERKMLMAFSRDVRSAIADLG